MNLTDEKVAFINGISLPDPVAKSASTSTISNRDLALPVDAAKETAQKSPVEEITTPAAPKKRPTQRPRSTYQETSDHDFYSEMLVPLTTRIKSSTADALRRACLEQKLARKFPDTQQEILEIAIAAWLKSHQTLI